MKFLLWFLALFAFAVGITLATHNPGYVQLAYPPYRIEMSLTLFVLSSIALFVFGYILVRMVLAALKLPSYVRAFREDRAQSKGRSAMMDALTAFFEGRYSAAEHAAVRAMELGEKSGLNPIVAARSAHELREFDKRDAYLADAENKSVGESTMRLMAKTEFQLDQKQPQSALGSLKELSDTGKHKQQHCHIRLRQARQRSKSCKSIKSIIQYLKWKRVGTRPNATFSLCMGEGKRQLRYARQTPSH